jgi:predicted flap endonuclease-1-like 5' DNA nuclease
METKQKIIAEAKSPSKNVHIRDGTGFSLSEIKKAGKTVNMLKEMNIRIDYFRKSTHSVNIEKLKSLEVPKKKAKKRAPFIPKEKKRTTFKPKAEKKIVKKAVKPKATPVKAAPKPKKKEKIKPTKLQKIEKAPPQAKGASLTDLSGLGATTAKKFIELGVDSIEVLCKENPEELAPLIKGVSADRLKKWIEEGKELIK